MLPICARSRVTRLVFVARASASRCHYPVTAPPAARGDTRRLTAVVAGENGFQGVTKNKNITCYNCGKTDHFVSKFPNQEGNGGGTLGSGALGAAIFSPAVAVVRKDHNTTGASGPWIRMQRSILLRTRLAYTTTLRACQPWIHPRGG